MTAPVTRAHRLAVALADLDLKAFSELPMHYKAWVDGLNPESSQKWSVQRLAQLVADAEGRALLAACDWMHKRGHKSAATDLDYNWNDPGQLGDGSCQPLHTALPKPPEPT